MNKIYELKEITYGPFFYKDQVLICNRQHEYLFFSAMDYSLLHKLSLEDVYTIDVLEGQIYLYNRDLYKYDDKSGTFVIHRASLKGGFVVLFNEHFIETQYDWDRDEVEVVFYEEASNNIRWTKIFRDRGGILNFGDHLYITDDSLKHIDFIDAKTGNIRKTLDFVEPSISRFIYYYDDTLIVALEGKPFENYCLLGLDATTGYEKWRTEHAFDIYTQDSSTGLLYALSGNFYQVVDAKTGKIVCQDDLSSEMAKFNVIPEAGGRLTKDGIYFRGRLSGKFGLLNINTHKFEFVEDLGVKEGVRTNSIRCHGDKVYILDSMNVLHIWGKE